MQLPLAIVLHAFAIASAPHDTLVAAEQLFARGQTCYETADYACAIELWTMAYDEISQAAIDDPSARALLIYNLAQAHRRAYEVDRDAEHLRRARALLLTYVDLIEVVTQDPNSRAREHLETEQAIDDIDAELARVDASEVVMMPDLAASPAPSQAPARRGLALEIVGANVLAIGVLGGTGLTLAGVLLGRAANDFSDIAPFDHEARAEQLARGRRANLLARAGAGAGGALLVLGVALLGGGVAMHRRHAGERARAWQVLPSLDAQGRVGLVVGGSF